LALNGYVFLPVLSIAYAGFDEGKAAYDRGDFVKAYAEFKPSAEQGNALPHRSLSNCRGQAINLA
jgi:hypothetical protein